MVGNSTSQAMFIGQGYDLKEGASARGERWAWNTVAGTPLHLAPVQGIVLGQGLGSFVGCLPESNENVFRPTGGIIPEVRGYKCAEDKLVLTSSTMNAQINTHRLPVLGMFDGGLRDVDRRAIHMSLADAQRLLDTDHISMMSVSLNKKDHIATFLQMFSGFFAKEGRLEAVPWRQHSFGTLSRGAEQILNMFRNVFMVIVAAISLMSVANTMMRVIHERSTEIGSLRSFGFRQTDIQTLFAFEGMFLALSACLGGLVVTIFLTLAVNALGIPYKGGILSAPIYLIVHQVPWSWLLNLTVLATIATLTSWLASAKIARAQVAVLLSQETH
jgi:putative ABC transport system permease protein